MKDHMVKLKQTNMLCNKCVGHVLRALVQIDGIKELDIDLKTKSVKVVYDNESLTREMVTEIVNNAIENGVSRIRK